MLKNKTTAIGLSVALLLAILATTGAAISAQDKYTLKVPNGLAFAQFRGYETWETISISSNGGRIAVILGNPAMIEAFKGGTPGNGKPFPDGAKMAKVHWNPKTNAAEPGQPLVPDTLHDVDFMAKDSKLYADSGGPTTAGERRQMRICMPHRGDEAGLRFHAVPEEVTHCLCCRRSSYYCFSFETRSPG
jgi:hypothetical protein